GDAQAAVLAHDVVDDLEVLRWRRDRPADALDRLADETGDLAGGLVADHVLDVAGALDVAAGVGQAEGAAVAVAGRGVLDVERRVALELPGAVRRQAHGGLGAAVVAVAQAEDLGVAGELARRQDGDLVGLAAGVGEVGHRQAAAG